MDATSIMGRWRPCDLWRSSKRDTCIPDGSQPALTINRKGNMVLRFGYGLLTSVLLLASIGFPFLPAPVAAQGQRFFAFNSTTRTDFTEVYMAPVGTQNWGPKSSAQ